MEKVRFLNSQNVYEGEVSVCGNVAAIRFAHTLPPQDVLTNGFELLNENNGIVQADYGAYTTVYRTQEEDGMLVAFSNDGSVYTPPVLPEPEPLPQPYVPTYEETRSQKILALSQACQQAIEGGLDINGLHYSYTEKDQINLLDIAGAVKLTGLPLGYHADGHSCTAYSAEELTELYTRLAMHKYCQQTYFNQARAYLKSLEESEENKAVVEAYTYGTPLTGTYLATYHDMVSLYHAQLEALGRTAAGNDTP